MPVVFKVTGFKEIQQALKAVEDGSLRDMRQAIRTALLPAVVDAKARFEGLGGSGARRTASTVRAFATANGIGVQFGGKYGFEFGKEFGAKGNKTSTFAQKRPSGTVQVTRTIDYANPHIFNTWTGNQFALTGGAISGRAFHPAVQAHWRVASAEMSKVLGRYADKIEAVK